MKKADKRKVDKLREGRWEGVGAAIIILVIMYLIVQGYKTVTGYFGDKSDAKASCGRHYTVLDAKTDYAAKKAYKACLKRY